MVGVRADGNVSAFFSLAGISRQIEGICMSLVSEYPRSLAGATLPRRLLWLNLVRLIVSASF